MFDNENESESVCESENEYKCECINMELTLWCVLGADPLICDEAGHNALHIGMITDVIIYVIELIYVIYDAYISCIYNALHIGMITDVIIYVIELIYVIYDYIVMCIYNALHIGMNTVYCHLFFD